MQVQVASRGMHRGNHPHMQTSVCAGGYHANNTEQEANSATWALPSSLPAALKDNPTQIPRPLESDTTDKQRAVSTFHQTALFNMSEANIKRISFRHAHTHTVGCDMYTYSNLPRLIMNMVAVYSCTCNTFIYTQGCTKLVCKYAFTFKSDTCCSRLLCKRKCVFYLGLGCCDKKLPRILNSIC